MSSDPIPPEFERLDPRVIAYERVGRLIRGGILVLVLSVLAGLAFADDWLTPALRGVLLALAILWVGLQVLGTILMPRLVHRYTGYRINAVGLEIRRGVLWRSIVTVARSRIQHLDVTQGPLERKYGLGTVEVHTAGTQDATITLDGIAHETAMAVRDDLSDRGEDGDGV